ncbi:hypothetical protein [Sphingomonas lutea]|nr:hypothetical protein [Sphingomonas lutea]
MKPAIGGWSKRAAKRRRDSGEPQAGHEERVSKAKVPVADMPPV